MDETTRKVRAFRVGNRWGNGFFGRVDRANKRRHIADHRPPT